MLWGTQRTLGPGPAGCVSSEAESPLRGLALGLSFPGCKPGADQRSRAPPAAFLPSRWRPTPQNPRTQPPGRGLAGPPGLSAPPVLGRLPGNKGRGPGRTRWGWKQRSGEAARRRSGSIN